MTRENSDIGLSSVSMLCVDESGEVHPKISELVGGTLKMLHYAGSLAEAIVKFHKHKPEILLVSLTTPDEKNIEMIRAMKDIEPELHVIVVSFFHQEQLLIQAVNVGISRYLPFPIEGSRFLQMLSEIFHLIKMKREIREVTMKVEDYYQTLSADVGMASVFQQNILPDLQEFECDGRFDIHYYYKPYDVLSGDFVAIEYLDESRLGILVVDIMGHGVSSCLATIEVKTIFEAEGKNVRNPADFLRIINQKAVCIRKNQSFMTATYVIYDFSAALLKVASSGGVPVLVQTDETDGTQLIKLVGDPIGMYHPDDFYVEETSLFLNSGDRVLIQTDGIIECHDEANNQFDSSYTQKRIAQIVREHTCPKRIIEALVSSLEEHMGGDGYPEDDITLVAFRINHPTHHSSLFSQ